MSIMLLLLLRLAWPRPPNHIDPHGFPLAELNSPLETARLAARSPFAETAVQAFDERFALTPTSFSLFLRETTMNFDISRFTAKQPPRPSHRLRMPKATEDVFFHPEEERRTAPLNVVRDGDYFYVVAEELVDQHSDVRVMLCELAEFHDGDEECLMPVRVDRGSDLDVVREAAKRNRTCRLVWRDGARHIEDTEGKIEPKWSDNFGELLAKILENNVIESVDHPVFEKLLAKTSSEGDAA